MKKIQLRDKVIHAIDTYIENYANYFFALYSDTGIFSENQILEIYQNEANNREQELHKKIKDIFSSNIVLGRTGENTLFLQWRSKTLYFTWIDEGDTRIITELIIR